MNWGRSNNQAAFTASKASDADLKDTAINFNESLQVLCFAAGDKLILSHVSQDLKYGIATNESTGNSGLIILSPLSETTSSKNTETITPSSAQQPLRLKQAEKSNDYAMSQGSKRQRNREYEERRKSNNTRGHALNLFQGQKSLLCPPCTFLLTIDNDEISRLLELVCCKFPLIKKPIFSLSEVESALATVNKIDKSKIWRVWLKEETWNVFSFVKQYCCPQSVTNAQLFELLVTQQLLGNQILEFTDYSYDEIVPFWIDSNVFLLSQRYWNVSEKSFTDLPLNFISDPHELLTRPELNFEHTLSIADAIPFPGMDIDSDMHFGNSNKDNFE